QARDVRQLALLGDLDLEAGGLQGRSGVPVRAAAAGHDPPRTLEPVLPARRRRVRRADMLDEEERAAGPEYAPHLAKGGRLIGHRAEHGGADDRVERGV